MMNKTLSIRTSFLLSVALLSSCTMIPGYKRPALPVPETLPVQATQPPAPSITQTGWKKFFHSPALQKVIQAALDNNRDLRVAALNVKAARALYRIQRSDLVPNVNAGISGTRQNVTDAQSGGSLTSGIGSQYSAEVGVTAFELDLFGRLRSENQAALETYFASRSAHDATQVALIAETANAYLQWLADQKILKLTQDTLAAQENSYTLVNARYTSGIASKLDLAQAQTALETAKANLAVYVRRVEQDKNALQLLIGSYDPALLSPPVTLDEIQVMKELPVGVQSSVLLTRPDVQQAEHQLLSANANIGAARAAFFPRITLTGSYGFASRDLSSLFSSGSKGAWSFIPQATLPIFTGGSNLATLSYSNVNKEIVVAQYEHSIQTAFREVNDALVARKTLDSQYEALHNLTLASQQSYDLSYTRYKQGVDNFLSVLDSQRVLYRSQQAEIESQQELLANLVNLYKALGGGTLSE